MKFISKTSILLFLIFLLALFLRLYRLGSIPVGLHVDEVNAGYVGRYILLHGGHDMFNNVLPLYFNKFGDFRPTGIFYLSGLSTFLFGINSFAIRFPSAFFGALSVFPLYFLATRMFQNKKTALLSSLFLALMPWHIELSRATSESIIGMFFLLCGLCFLSAFLKSNKRRDLSLSFLFLLIPYFLYHIYRFLTPILLVVFLSTLIGNRIKKQMFTMAVLFGFLTLLFVVIGQGAGRFSQVAFYKNPAISSVLTYLHTDSFHSVWEDRLFHNKIWVMARELSRQYDSYFSLDFLFGSGGLPERYRVPENGLLPIVWSVFIAVGVFALSQNPKQKKTFLFLLFFLLFAPLAAAFTYEDAPNVQRSVLLVVPLSLFAGYGFVQLLRIQPKAMMLVLIGFFSLIALYEQGYFWHQYTAHTAHYKPYSRSGGERAVVFELLSRKKQFKTIVAPIYEEIPQLLLFYTNDFASKDAAVFDKNVKRTILSGITFVDASCPSREFSRFDINDSHPLVVDSISCEHDVVGTFKEVGFVTYLNGDKAYRLLTL